MSSVLCLTLRFLDAVPQFHGRGDNGDPEWPPSPLRFFQALVSAAATRWREDQFREYVRPALQWLEAIQPTVVAPQVAAESFGYRMYVPNNSGDLMTAAWARGDTETSMAKFRVEKDVRPTHLHGGDAVHYLFSLPDGACPHFDILAAAARSITHLGWGVDMVAGNANLLTDGEAVQLPGERWRPVEDRSAIGYRVPIPGTLDALVEKHNAFLNRLGPDGFKPVPPLSAFRVVGYRRDRDLVKRPVAAFSILKLDASGFRPFDTVRWGRCVAGMLRHAARVAAENSGWPKEKRDSFILGHAEAPDEDHKPAGPKRFAYLPLPSIERRGDAGCVVTEIRRALFTVLGESGHQEIAWARRHLSGAELVADRNGKLLAECEANNLSSHDPLALLSLLPESDKGVIPYTKPSFEWTTVTPVALPGSDEGKASKTDKLLEKMFRHAGYSLDLLADWPEYQRVPFLRGAEDAKKYRPREPHYLANCTMYHMRIRWKHPMPGPIVLGSGRYCGVGLFAAID
jgi:CRISPR-associated protein Csb2